MTNIANEPLEGKPGKNKMPIHTRILIGLIAGAIAGITINMWVGRTGIEGVVKNVTEPIGRIWLASLIMVVIPLIISTLSLGVAGLGDLKKLGRIGLLTLATFLLLTTLSSTLGLVTMNVFRPGDGLDPQIREQLMTTYKGEAQGKMGLAEGSFGVDLFVKMIPRNPVAAMANGEMLAIIFFALALGVGMTLISREKAEPMFRFMDSLGHVIVAIIKVVMLAAPIGVFCLIFSVTARFGYDQLLNLMKYFLTVIGSLVFFQVVCYPIMLKLIARVKPGEFFRRIGIVMITAFSTSSSNATLPTTMRIAEENLGIRREIGGFVLPLGATMNMNGTALFEGATVLFLAQVFGIQLSMHAQIIVVIMSVITAIGVAGIPGGSIPLLMMVLGLVGVPMEGIAIVLGVDRILDMCRTVLNVTGDLVTATIVNRFEGRRTRKAEAMAEAN